MTLQEALNQLSRYVVQQTTDVQPDDPKFDEYIKALDDAQQSWGNEPGVKWEALHGYHEIKLSTAQSYELPPLELIEDRPVLIKWLDANNNQQQESYTMMSSDYFPYTSIGRNSTAMKVSTIKQNQLFLSWSFQASDPAIQHNAVIRMPCHQKPNRITNTTDLSTQIQCPDPMFIIDSAASELVLFNDVKHSKRLREQATQRMQKMKQEERRRTRQSKRSAWRPAGRTTGRRRSLLQ